MLQQLAEDCPDKHEYRLELARLYTYGYRYLPGGPERVLNLCINLAHQLVAEAPDVPEYWKELAGGYNNLAGIQDGQGRFAEAETNARENLHWSEKLAAAFPDEWKYQNQLSNAHNTLGEVFNHSHRFSEAEREYRQAIVSEEKALSRSPSNPWRRGLLAVFNFNLVLCHLSNDG